MRVLLINPPDTHSVNHSLGKTNTPKLHNFAPPLGLMYIKAYLKQKLNAEVQLFNFQKPKQPTFRDLKEFLMRFRPDFVGITVYSSFWFDVCQVVSTIKAVLPDTIVVGGGPHMWTYPEESLVSGRFDIIVQGPGEKVFEKIINAHKSQKNGLDLSNIKGIFYKEGGKVKNTGPNTEKKNLDQLPFPDRTDFPVYHYRSPEITHSKTAIVMASTGCPFNCFYCDNRDRKYLPRNIDKVIDELFECQELGYKAIAFYDDVFTCSRKYVTALCKEMIRRNFKLPWSCMTRVDCIDRNLIKLMKKAGCEGIKFGVESGNQDILNSINKKITLDQCRKAFRSCREEGIATVGYFMIGFPWETIKMAQETFRFAEELDPDYVIFLPVVFMPGTDLYKQAAKAADFDKDWLKKYIINPTPTVEIKSWYTAMTEEEIVTLINRFYRRYYSNPKRIIRYIKHIHNINDLLIKMRAGFRVLTGK